MPGATSEVASSGGGGRQGNAPQKSHQPPEKPRGKSKRTLIESACTACQRRKSRCDGSRPVCSRCRTLKTDCEYNAEEGESRWSALRRKSQALERERDEAREVLRLMQTRPEHEAQEIYRRIRASVDIESLSPLIQEVRAAIGAAAAAAGPSQQTHQQQQSQQQQHQHKQMNQQQGFQPRSYGASATSPMTSGPTQQLPPLRSVVNMLPTSGTHQPLTQHIPPQPQYPSQRQSSRASGMSDESYSTISSSDEHRSASPKEDEKPGWAQRRG